MSFMRLGTRVAVINDAGEILLSKRGDFGVWALPGGRVDSGELLHESAIREVREETGLEVEIVQAVGLYFQQGRGRTNIVYRAKPVGGQLFDKTDETLANQFFAPDNLPDDLFGKLYIDHAYTDETHLHTETIPQLELVKINLRLGLRWIQNLLAGRPEPKFVRFDVRAVGIIWYGVGNPEFVLVQDNNKLPNIESDGTTALHKALDKQTRCDVLNDKHDWKWCGLWQNTKINRIEFIFETTALANEKDSGKWIWPFEVSEDSGIHQRYLEMKFKHDDVWLLQGDT